VTDDKPQRALVAGWFSFENTAAAVGDVLAKDLVCEWLDLAGVVYDVALAPPLTGGVDYFSVDPARYSHLIFVCGPFYKSNLLQRFEGCHRIGINLSMVEPVDSWNPFDLLLERDSSAATRPDITFLSSVPRVPVVGLVLGRMDENAGRPGSSYQIANAALQQLVESRDMSAVPIDTRLDIPTTGSFRTAREIESLIGRMDVVLTTRLHGLVLALKNGVPAIAIDPIPQGDKIRRQAEILGWPLIFTVDDVTTKSLQEAFDYAITESARIQAQECYRGAVKGIEELRDTFLSAMQASDDPNQEWGDHRRRGTWISTISPAAHKPSISRPSAYSRMRLFLSQIRRQLINR
jgi:polysaccharide pyruvyl transferase